MNIIRGCSCVCILLALASFAGSARAQSEDVFAFIPSGGRSLLVRIAKEAPNQEIKALLSAKRTREEWVSHMQDRAKSVAVFQGLSEGELLTLADYLAFNMPLPADKVPADPGKAKLEKLLPKDGRDYVMEECQFCHVITVVVTQDKTQTAWLGTMNKPSHIEIKLTPEQREALANYLVLNGSIPEDDVPEELRVGGASY